MSIETAKKQFAEIVVGAFAAAVFVFFRVFESAAPLPSSCWTTGRGPVGASKRYTKATRTGDDVRHRVIMIATRRGYVLGITATRSRTARLMDPCTRSSSPDQPRASIRVFEGHCSVLDTLDADLNKALCFMPHSRIHAALWL